MIFCTYHSSSAGNMYSVCHANTTLLIEVGITAKRIREALGFKLSTVRAALITHSHADHSQGCKDMLKFGIDCYMTSGTAEKLKLNSHRLNIIEPMKQFKIDNFIILPFPTVHDADGSVGYLIQSGREKLLFLTDTAYCPFRFKNLTILAIECNWSKKTLAPNLESVVKRRLYKNHMSLARVIRFLQANDLSTVREIHLLHLSDGNSDEQLFKSKIQAATGKPVAVAGK